MSNVRTVYIDAEDVAAIEAGGYALIREEQNGPGIRLMALALKWRELGQPVGTPVFLCDVDESAGMAEVVELRGYSRKAPCA